MVKIFLDDIRQPTDCLGYMHTRIGAKNILYLDKDWIVVKNYQEFVDALDDNFPYISHISFDHDLGEEHYSPELSDFQEWEDYHLREHEETGYDCAKYFVEYYEEEGEQDWPEIFIHSMNPVGRERIESLFREKY